MIYSTGHDTAVRVVQSFTSPQIEMHDWYQADRVYDVNTTMLIRELRNIKSSVLPQVCINYSL